MPQIKIHSKIVLDHPAEAGLYYYLRVLDKQGQGWVRCGWAGLQRAFGQPKKSLLRILRNGERRGFFQQVEPHRDFVYVKLCTIRRVKERSGGAHSAAMVDPQVLTDRRELKRIAYQIALLRQQADSEFQINRQGVPSRNRFSPDMERSTVANGCDHVQGDTYFLKKRMNAPSASQITTAIYLNKARSTVVRWANAVPHVHLYKQVDLSDPVPQHHFRCYQIRKDGTRVQRQYRRLPNYYFPEREAKREARAVFRAPEVPGRGSTQTQQAELEAKLSVRESNRVGYGPKLAALGIDRVQMLACEFLSEMTEEDVDFPLSYSWEALTELMTDLVDQIRGEDLALLYRMTQEACGTKDAPEATPEVLDWFFQDRKIPSHPESEPPKELPERPRKSGQSKFLGKLSALPLTRIRQLCYDLMYIVQGRERHDMFEADRQTLVDGLKGTVPMLAAKDRQWLMILTDRAYKNLRPATPQMKSGMVSFRAQLDEAQLRRYFDGVL